MLVACWSVKGGSGTSVVAAALGLLLAESVNGRLVLADLGGDAAAVLGLPDREPDVARGVAAPEEARRVRSVRPNLDLLTLEPVTRSGADGHGCQPAGPSGDGLGRVLAEWDVAVVDCGPPGPSGAALAVAAEATVSLMVLRPCFLALRRAVAAPIRPSAVVLVTEPERALRRSDIEAALEVPVAAEVAWDPAVARAVDAGLLVTRLPRSLSSALRSAA